MSSSRNGGYTGVTENCQVDRVHARDGHDRFFADDDVREIENQWFDEHFDVHREIEHGLNICRHIDCHGQEPRPEVVVSGAGARFYHD